MTDYFWDGESFEDIYYDVYDKVQEEFLNGQEYQSWSLVPAALLKRVWMQFGKYGRVDSGNLSKVAYILKRNIVKIGINSGIKDGNDSSFFACCDEEGNESGDVSEETWERWFKFVSDRSGSRFFRNFGEVEGNARYSDRAKSLWLLFDKLLSAEERGNGEAVLMACDAILNFVHGLGSMAKWFVEGGVVTLNAIAEFAPKGATMGGWTESVKPLRRKIYESFILLERDWGDVEVARKSARKETETDPSEAQKESGNYRKGKFWWNSLEISIENPKGSTRSGKSRDGKEWSCKMHADYGYFRRTESEADGDHVDCFIGDDLSSQVVYIVNQVNPDNGKFDEHKCVIGVGSEKEAKELYRSCYEPSWRGLDSVVCMTVAQFREWLMDGDTGNPVKGT